MMRQALNEEGKLARQGFTGDDAESRMPFVHTLLGQGRLEQFILDSIHENSSLEVERSVVAEGLNFNEIDQEDHSAYPIAVQLRTVDSEDCSSKVENGVAMKDPSSETNGISSQTHKEPKVEIVKARYLLACDGARSWTRGQMGLSMEGSSTDYVWYVQDQESYMDSQ